jgi:hypothetical protein
MKRTILVSMFFLIFTSFMNLNAQWLKGYGKGRTSSIQETSDGGYIVAGSFRVEVTGEWGGMTYDYIRILKLFSDGDIHTYCEYISSSNATITDTDISPEVSYLSYQDTNVTPLDTDFPALLLSKNMPATTLCPPESTLDDEDDDPGKKCFIATAAYGSPLHPHLDILRDFRNKYLMPNKLGRAFVNLYYKYSPFVANIIAKRKVLKVVVRVSLLPLIALSYTILHFGHTITAILGGFIFLIPIFFVWFCQRKIRRLEAKFPKALAFLD